VDYLPGQLGSCLNKKNLPCINKQRIYYSYKNSTQMDTSKMIKAYCLKTKEKNVPMLDAVITKTARGGYMAAGHDGKGNKMAAILGEAKALQAIKDGVAKQNF
jgi:hypothetical protein